LRLILNIQENPGVSEYFAAKIVESQQSKLIFHNVIVIANVSKMTQIIIR